MIDGVGKTGPGRIDVVRPDQNAPVAAIGSTNVRSRDGTVTSAVFELVQSGPPVDSAKVAAIRTAIAEGRYPVDPQTIAARMLALDLPERGA